MASDPSSVTKLFEQLPLQAMQSVADGYMAWYVTRVTQSLDETIAGRRSELRDNDAKEASYRPAPAELSAIERMQRSGVTGVDLLDRMVEQGEDWLVLTMRRLDHFEKTGLAPKDYSTWCEHALGGAYDWIDHERLGASGASAAPSAPLSSRTPPRALVCRTGWPAAPAAPLTTAPPRRFPPLAAGAGPTRVSSRVSRVSSRVGRMTTARAATSSASSPTSPSHRQPKATRDARTPVQGVARRYLSVMAIEYVAPDLNSSGQGATSRGPQLKALNPVSVWPRIKVWMSSVPS